MPGSAIVGIGECGYTWGSATDEAGLAAGAIRAALADAGIASPEVDGIVRYGGDRTDQAALIASLDLPPPRFVADTAPGGHSAVALLALADAAIAHNRVEVVVGYRAFNGRSKERLTRPPADVDEFGTLQGNGVGHLGGRYSAPYGLVAPSTVFALWCRAYIERFGCNDGDFTDTLERIVVERRRYASRNPHALLRDKPLSSENYRASSLVAEPLRKADLCLESDGACAFVMVTADRARDQRKPPAFLWDTAIEVPADYFDMFLSRTELPPRAAVALLPPVLERHGLSHCDLNVLGMYDAASCNTVFDLEQLGFCPPGSAIGYLGNGHPPINTSGGMLAEIYLQGANQLIELIRQLRGESANQVPGAQLALLSGTSGMSIALLSSERPQ